MLGFAKVNTCVRELILLWDRCCNVRCFYANWLNLSLRQVQSLESIDTIEILRRWYNESPEIIGNIVEKLNVHGLVSDECGFGISSTMVEKWDDRCSQFLENCGYDGGRLAKTGKYIDGYGSVYVVLIVMIIHQTLRLK